MYYGGTSRNVYHIERIVSYRYQKTDTGIVSKWQINDTFNDTFYDDINKDRATLTQKWMMFFLLNAFFVFHFYIIWKLWSLNTIILYAEYTKRPKGKKGNFLMVWYRIVFYWYRFVSIGIVSYRKKIKGTHPKVVALYTWMLCKLVHAM